MVWLYKNSVQYRLKYNDNFPDQCEVLEKKPYSLSESPIIQWDSLWQKGGWLELENFERYSSRITDPEHVKIISEAIENESHAFSFSKSRYLTLDMMNNLSITNRGSLNRYSVQDSCQSRSKIIPCINTDDNLRVELESFIEVIYSGVHSFHSFRNRNYSLGNYDEGYPFDVIAVTNQQQVLWLRLRSKRLSRDKTEIIDITGQIPYIVVSVESNPSSCSLLTSDGKVLLVKHQVKNQRSTKFPRFQIEDEDHSPIVTLVELPIKEGIKSIQGILNLNFLLSDSGELFGHNFEDRKYDSMTKLKFPIKIRAFRLLNSNVGYQSSRSEAVIKDEFGNFHYVSWCGQFRKPKSKLLDIDPEYDFEPANHRSIKRAL